MRSTLLILSLWGASAGAVPLRVSVAGQIVEARAERLGEVVVGEVLPVVTALGLSCEVDTKEGKLHIDRVDGKRITAAFGGSQIEVEGQVRECQALFGDASRLTGPLTDLAEALGCAVRFDKSGQELRLAPRLSQVEAYAAPEGVLVHVRVLGHVKPELRRLDEPPRAYADFPSLTWLGKSETIEVGGTGGLRRIRWALFQEWPPVSRVVVDLEPGSHATMSEVGQGLYVIKVLPPARTPSVSGTKLDLAGSHIILDPAGGGSDPAGQGQITEGKSVNLDVAVRAAMALMDAGAIVTLTRNQDIETDLNTRARLVREIESDIVVRIECASTAKGRERGIATYYAGEREAELAAELQRALVGATGAPSRGVTQISEFVYPRGKALAVCCVVGNLSSLEEERLLATVEYRQRLAAGIVEGIAAYLGDQKGAP
ncbi:MAG: N-acetylmuramoyl-L-alanine amidase [Candidatus Zipacnadales bacterium]